VLLQATRNLSTALGVEHIRTLNARDRLATVLYQLNDFDGAAKEHTDILRIVKQNDTRGPAPEVVFGANLALDIVHLNRIGEAEKLFRDALTKARTFSSEASPLVQGLRYNLADCLLTLHRPDEARELLRDLNGDTLKLALPSQRWDAQ